MRSICKWAGGKASMVDVLMPLVLERRSATGRYIEPFLGGGAMALAMPEYIDISVADANVELCTAWNAVRNEPYGVSKILEVHRNNHSPAYYYDVRGWSDLTEDDEIAARFIYLNRMGFNGLYRKNKAGGFNVPLGRGKPHNLPTYGELVSLSSRMRQYWSQVVPLDFEALVDAALEGDVVYADPPYDGTFDYSSGFGREDRERLSAALRRAARRGVGVVLTDADTKLTRKVYKWMDLSDYREKRNISCDGDRSRAACIIGVRP